MRKVDIDASRNILTVGFYFAFCIAHMISRHKCYSKVLEEVPMTLNDG